MATKTTKKNIQKREKKEMATKKPVKNKKPAKAPAAPKDFTNKEARAFAKAWRVSRNTKAGSPNSLTGNETNVRAGKAAVKALRAKEKAATKKKK